METTIKDYEDLFNNVNIYYKGAKLNYFDKRINIVITDRDEEDRLPNDVIILGDKRAVYSFNIINVDDSMPFNIMDVLLTIIRVIDKNDYSDLPLEKQFDNIVEEFTFKVNTEVCTRISINRPYKHISCLITMCVEYEETQFYLLNKEVNKDISMPGFIFNAGDSSWVKDLIRIAMMGKEVISMMKEEYGI